MAFSLQQAYDQAAPGATIIVPPGVLATDSASRGAVTIFGTKAATFVAQDPTKEITHDCLAFTIKAPNVTVKGPGWWLHDVRIGEGYEMVRSASNVLLDGIHMDGLEVVGASATIRNCEIGPNVMGYAPGTTGNGQNGGAITPAMWLDPNASRMEAFYATHGGSQNAQGFQPYFHNNKGGVFADVTVEDTFIHDIQTLDAFNLHTGGGLIWQGGGTVIYRRCRYVNCCILGLLVEDLDGLVFEDNVCAAPVEPWSNVGRKIVEAPSGSKELIGKKNSSATIRNWKVSRNKFCHGTRASAPADASCVFDSNDLGADAPWAGATYINNTNQGSGCAGVIDPPPPTDTLPLTLISQTATTITLGWTPVSCIGYRFLVDGKLVSNTWDQSKSQVRFKKVDGATYRVEAVQLGVFGSYKL